MNTPKYSLSKENEFVIENYNSAPAFSSFLPGIAGIWGCPMWVFYANRGQCITSCGIHDKNGSIMEFQPANKAYRTVSLQGFRTFIKVDGKFYAPFSESASWKKEMRVTAEGLKIVEENTALKLKIEVAYFTLPGESFPALARKLKITNLSNKNKKIEVLDGLPILIPYGFNNDLLKKISQTIEAWGMVENLAAGAPFYKLKVVPSDTSDTRFIDAGNFFLSFINQKGKDSPAAIIVDPKIVFGENSSLELPANFMGAKSFTVPAQQQTEGFTPCAFAFKKLSLSAKEEIEICSIFGQAENVKVLNRIKDRVLSRKYFDRKALENRALIGGICSMVKTESASENFDLYCRQTFLDNVMRGGLPISLENKVFYAYYRKHGDMERDYNDFKLMPIYFSQGNGNYRDINQNRRCDLFFNPAAAEDNIVRFFNLVQLDGFNPLVIIGSRFFIKSHAAAEEIVAKNLKDQNKNLARALTSPFVLGLLLRKIEMSGLEYKTSKEVFARELLDACETEEVALHGEGYWTDHFSYNTDLLESFESIYPDKIEALLFNQKTFVFFDNDHVVLSRREKYRLAGKNVRQYQSVKIDPEKSALLNSRIDQKNTVRADFGKGGIYQTTLIVKILCLIANKAASFDAEGIGLEMEADKPDWYDALNGLPALFGSSLSETLELKRLCVYTLRFLTPNGEFQAPEELKEFVESLSKNLKDFASDSFSYWEESGKTKEAFRAKTRLGLSGKEKNFDKKEIIGFLTKIIKKCDAGLAKLKEKYGNYYTYFINEAIDYETLDNQEMKINQFKQKPLPLFLEGFVHALKVEKDKSIYQLVKKSPLFDKKLGMYKVNASLKDAPVEIGRCKIFTPGWLENESIWLHMEYKYMLELLKAGLYDEFFSDFKKVLVPFMDPKKYKRSILENSSFIVSSAHPDQKKHGQGFVSRLSGSTAEFIDMWVIMMTGKKLFSLDENGKLCFKLSPVLPAWLFKKGKLSFNLFGSIEITYLNPKKKNTFNGGVSPVSYKLILEDGKEIEINASFIAEPYASLIRGRKIKNITVQLS